MILQFLFVVLVIQAPDDAPTLLNRAYEHLRNKDYEVAIGLFQQVLAIDPSQVRVHREIGYTYQKMGETGKAVAAFKAYAQARPDDLDNLLELGYACVQVKEEARALELFRRVQIDGTPPQQEQARRAYQAVEEPLLAEMARWKKVVDAEPGNLDAREALAEAYGQHGDRKLAIEQLQELRRRAPSRVRHLLTLATLYEGQPEANAYYLLAWRSADSRVSAAGHQGIGNRYPYGPEFEKALELEPWHNAVRKELGYLYLELKRPKDALAHFEWLALHDPEDKQSAKQLEYLRGGGGPPAQAPVENDIRRHRELGYANLQRSYLPAAAAEFEAVHRLDPDDSQVILQLGYIYNLLKRDDVALGWFKMVRSSPDAEVARRARDAVRNLTKADSNVITTVWAMPFWSTRFDSAFGYGQIKTEWRNKHLPFRPYLSMRFVGDSRTRTGGSRPVILSDDGAIAAVGIQAQLSRRLFAWAEAGNAVSGLGNRPRGLKRSEPDYRGGLAWAKTWGPTLFQNESGRFLEATVDAVYLSRFGNNGIAYTQTKTGYQMPKFHGLFHQPFVTMNLFADARGDFFNNVLEVGPGYRVGLERFKSLSVYLAVVRGIYTTRGRRTLISGRPNYTDMRLVMWYAKSF